MLLNIYFSIQCGLLLTVDIKKMSHSSVGLFINLELISQVGDFPPTYIYIANVTKHQHDMPLTTVGLQETKRIITLDFEHPHKGNWTPLLTQNLKSVGI